MSDTAKRLPAFATRLRELRERAGLTKYGLAQRCTLTAQAIANLESGTTPNPSWDTIQELARVLGVTTDYFREN